MKRPSPSQVPYPPGELLEHFRRMLLIRAFEEALSELFAEGAIPGTAHFCVGQEACAVGATAALRPDDLVTSNHRGHGHIIARGEDVRRLMAELFGKATGLLGGRSGSQHLCDMKIGFLGSNGITGGMVPIATGAALAQLRRGTGRVVLSFFGDGASGQGVVMEVLNMAATWKLPVVYFCENNHYAMSMPAERAFAEPSIAARFAGFGMPTVSVDGMDYFAVRQATAEAVERARRGDGPALIEADTYRFCGHSKSDERAYRTREEEERWRQRDPLDLMARRLAELGVLTRDEREKLQQQVAGEVEAAKEFAQTSPDPDPATSTSGVYSSF